MRKISVSGYGYFERFGPERSLAFAKEAGFDAFDYPLYGKPERAKFDIGESVTDPRHAREIARYARELGIEIGQTHAPFGYRKGDGSSTELILDIYRRAAETTAILGAKHMVVHPVKFADCAFDHLRKECFDWNIEIFSRLSPILKEFGVVALLENMFIKEQKEGFTRLVPTIYSTGEELSRAKDILGDSFGVCLDSGHAYITKEDVPEMVRTIGDRLLALHLHDNTGDRDDHLPPYFGNMPTDDMLAALKEIRYGGNLNFEVRLDAVPEERLPTALRYLYDVGVSFRRFLDGE